VSEPPVRLFLGKNGKPGLRVDGARAGGVGWAPGPKAVIKEMIQHQQDRYDWHFTFLAANQDAFAEAGRLGIHRDRAALLVAEKISSAYKVTGSKTSRMRKQRRTGMPVEDRFTDEERDSMT
jgi:hypothetical protein